MRQVTSNKQMDKSLELLNNIRRVDTPGHVYQNVLSAITEQKQETVSVHWMRVAAAVLLLFLAADIYIVINHSNKAHASVESAAPIQNNLFYNE